MITLSRRHVVDGHASLAPMAGATKPLRMGAAWMAGTYGGYLVLGDKDSISLLLLTTFVALAILAWVAGYHWGVRTFPLHGLQSRYGRTPSTTAWAGDGAARQWVLASGVYFILYGYSLLKTYGATPASYFDAIRNPGAAYAAKFEVIEGLSTQTGNTLLQVLILLSLLQLPLGPLIAFYWSDLSAWIKAVGVAGILWYVAYFLYIGTMQGLGFLLIGLIAGVVARHSRGGNSASQPRRSTIRRRGRLVIAVGVVTFAIYMINALAQRLETFDVHNRFQPSPLVAEVVGEDFARGLAVLAHYPTHGYRGLALNLEQPFEWSAGRGSSRAVDSYWEQIFGDSVFQDTYPARTERATGYSATIHWSTVYPWLASDLSFPGALILMLFIGRWTARMWLRTILFRDPLALMLFSQLMLFIAFISVNNQVLISRPALIAVLSCLGIYLGREVVALKRDSERT